MSDACQQCGRVPPHGQRLWPVTRYDAEVHRFRPQRLCLACLTSKDPNPKIVVHAPLGRLGNRL